jgi:O-antigen/teichoic acid export membrane protein
LFFVADDVVVLLFGHRWTSAGPVLSILALVIPLRGLTLISSTVFWSANQPKALAVARTLEAILFVAVLYPLISAFGLAGVAWAGFIAYAFACVNRVVALNKIVPGISARLWRSLVPAFLFLIVLVLVRFFISR